MAEGWQNEDRPISMCLVCAHCFQQPSAVLIVLKTDHCRNWYTIPLNHQVRFSPLYLV